MKKGPPFDTSGQTIIVGPKKYTININWSTPEARGRILIWYFITLQHNTKWFTTIGGNIIWFNYGVWGWAIEYWCDIIRAAIIGRLFVGHNPLGTSVIRVAARIRDNGWVAWGWNYVLCHPNLQFVLMSDCDGMPAVAWPSPSRSLCFVSHQLDWDCHSWEVWLLQRPN